MTDLSALSDDQLRALYAAPAPAGDGWQAVDVAQPKYEPGGPLKVTVAKQWVGKAPQDMTDEELVAAYQGGPDFSAASAPQPDNPDLAAALDRKRLERIDPGLPTTVAAKAAQGLTLGFSDEALAGIKSGFGLAGDYNQALQHERDILSRASEARPVASALSEIGGTLATSFVPGLGAANAVRGATLAAKIGKGALTGAKIGAISGTGTAEGGIGDRAKGAIEGAVIGGVTGGAIPLAGRVVGNVIGSRAGKALVPSVDELKARASALYDQAKQIGLVVKPQAFDGLVSRIKADVGAYHPAVTQKGAAVLKSLDKARGKPLTLEEIDLLRQLAGQVAKAPDANERRIAGIVMEHIDNWLTNLRPQDAAAGNPKAAAAIIGEARDLWKRQAKGAIIERAIESAGNAASGGENGLRVEFRKLLKPRYRWTPDEYKAIQKVVRGDVGTNALRFLGMFGYSIDQARNFLGPLIGGGIGAAAGPIGAVAVPVIGTAARAGAKVATANAAERASAVVRNAGAKPFAALPAQIADERTRAILEGINRSVVIPTGLELARAK